MGAVFPGPESPPHADIIVAPKVTTESPKRYRHLISLRIKSERAAVPRQISENIII